jgi:NAD(P)H-dependent FMN reductase
VRADNRLITRFHALSDLCVFVRERDSHILRSSGSGKRAKVSKLHVIIGSTRPGRAADLVAPWVISRTRNHSGFDVEVLDLREWALPMFAETFETVGDFNDPTYSSPVVRSWNHKIAEADAFLVITPEYNHSVPAVLKNAIDSVFVSFAFRNKPVAVVGYSGGIAGGVRAIEHLAQIAIEAEMVPLRTATIIPQVFQAFTPDSQPAPISACGSLSMT